ncbi:DNA polymerase IV [Nitrosomonas oligotropha]|uniref:DNA polymerase IV n=1 Tax=Nitrosomonas oligotropha TaxID=42354 RepID=UPI00136AEB6F|nr:DNA polymerase IV [Nitrosomonas oligotropha]MXS82975.1 DNA polymerase IV [Nitrosomonas oligotropha]
MNTPQRRIAHLDMDAFYASVELLRYPELRGLPVVIGGRDEHQPVLQADGKRHFYRLRDYAGRGVITTATYEARALGVHSAMGVMKAAQLAPDAILLPVDFPVYRHYSRLFKAAVAGIAAQIEDSGIDEIYIDLTGLPEDTLPLARRIKQAVKDATGLSCSIGITPNKLLAKICSDLEKPDGLTILAFDDIAERIWPLPVRKINGIGPKAANKLASLGITTIAELTRAELSLLQMHFGRSYSAWLYEVSRGIDQRPVITNAEPKSISRETTFERDLHPRQDRPDLSEAFTALCVQVAGDLKRKGYAGRTISIKLRFEDFRTITRDFSLPAYTNDPARIRRAAGECLRRVPLQKKIRLLGVKVSTLCAETAVPMAEASRQRELPLVL